jgi:hypothetical protein
MKSSYRGYSKRKYHRKEDFRIPIILTVSAVREEELPSKKEKSEKDLILYFDETDKGIVCNQTRGAVMEQITGSENPLEWICARVEVFWDPDIKYGGKREGGIGFRRPTVAPPAEKQAATPDEVIEEEIAALMR